MPSAKRKSEGDAASGDDVAAQLTLGLEAPLVDNPTVDVTRVYAPLSVKEEPEEPDTSGSPPIKPARKRGRKKKGTPVPDSEGQVPPPNKGDSIEKGDKKVFRGGQAHWCAMLYDLLLYKSNHGHTNVRPDDNDPSSRTLYAWCVAQRKQYKLYREGCDNFSYLTIDRVAVLDAAGFEWNVRGDAFWKKQYAALKDYRLEHGHTMIPRNWEKDPKPGEWVTDQRRQYRFRQEGKPSLMTDDRMQKLQALNFTWRIRDRIDWSDRYNELLEFRTENGHCIVPQHYLSNKPLGKWVAKQREQYRFKVEGKHSFLTEERIQLLNDIGFAWSIKGRSHKVRQSLEQGPAPGGSDDSLKGKTELKQPASVDVTVEADPVATAVAVAAGAVVVTGETIDAVSQASANATAGASKAANEHLDGVPVAGEFQAL
eukprot:CAMPEP_0113547012 /NCGR_PEP_ID=MMETSP0015_2-20120614/12119_1 /TAXON_ID=2838 /ORGANISM="Odontella" /LENGTH=425 /DNA_ID=CAMNT_0000447519 /DNA_START=402 /DNA_END=1679 /DNA_ORIENTATION=+ /assembly_acc=CAM_ASM_000160